MLEALASVFRENAVRSPQLVAYSANTAHHLDIGAATPGLIIVMPRTGSFRGGIGVVSNCGEHTDVRDRSPRSLRCG